MTKPATLARALRAVVDDTGEVAVPARAFARALPEGHPARILAERAASLAESILDESCPVGEIDERGAEAVRLADRAIAAYWL